MAIVQEEQQWAPGSGPGDGMVATLNTMIFQRYFDKLAGPTLEDEQRRRGEHILHDEL